MQPVTAQLHGFGYMVMTSAFPRSCTGGSSHHQYEGLNDGDVEFLLYENKGYKKMKAR